MPGSVISCIVLETWAEFQTLSNFNWINTGFDCSKHTTTPFNHNMRFTGCFLGLYPGAKARWPAPCTAVGHVKSTRNNSVLRYECIHIFRRIMHKLWVSYGIYIDEQTCQLHLMGFRVVCFISLACYTLFFWCVTDFVKRSRHERRTFP